MTMTAARRQWSFGLRTLFVLVTLAAVPLGWRAYALNWIAQRHRFLSSHSLGTTTFVGYPAPYGLGLFGEEETPSIKVDGKDRVDEAKRLFPEAKIEVDEISRELWEWFREFNRQNSGDVPHQ